MVNIGLILEYDTIFSEEPMRELSEYFRGASRKRLLDIGSFLLGIKNTNSAFRDNRHTLGTIFGPENNAFANEAYRKILRKENETGQKIQIFQPFVSLKLFEFLFKNVDQGEFPEQTSAELELNFFKAYLIVGSEFLKSQSPAFSSVKHLDPELGIPMMVFCMSYTYSDKLNYDIKQQWVTQTVKANALFKFLETTPETSHLLAAFLHYYKCATWKDYLVKYIPLTLSLLKKDRETYTDIVIQKDEAFNESCDFLENFIIYENELPKDELDFLTLRSKPLYKINRGEYRIIFDLFAIEKIHKGLYFALRDMNAKLPLGQQIKEFKSFYGKSFSEGCLTYQAIESIYPNKCTKFSGDELDKIMDGAPDYYVRRGKDILLFESKDFLVSVKAKESYDYAVYDEVFEERLYFTEKNGKQHNKAVMQLIESIRRVLTYKFPADTKYKSKEINIYPIIVIHDHQFDAAGLRELINSWFLEELDLLRSEGINISRVKHLVLVNIDQLLYFQVRLGNDISLHHVIDKYLEFVKFRPFSSFASLKAYQEYLLPKIVPFSIFLSNYLVKRYSIKLPPLLSEMGLELFDEQIK